MDLYVKIAAQAILNEVNNGGDENIAISPMSISAMMNLKASRYRDPNELSKWLHFLGAETLADVDANSQLLIEAARPCGQEGPVLSFANGVWIDKNLSLQATFHYLFGLIIEKAKTVYNARFKLVDIVDEAEEVIKEVNKWVEAETRGLIKSILPPKSLIAYTAIILANALYFKGFWLNEFDPKSTKDGSFSLLNKQVVQVPFMTKIGNSFHYRSFDDFKVLKLEYKFDKCDTRRFSMHFLLPDQTDGLPKLVQRMSSSPEMLYNFQELQIETIDVLKIPKFKISYGFDVNQAMEKELGLRVPKELFTDKNKVFKMRHKSFIEVNEEGTEAAASTESDDDLGFSLYQPPLINFIVDRPFVFTLMEETSGVIFFVGAVLNPLSAC